MSAHSWDSSAALAAELSAVRAELALAATERDGYRTAMEQWRVFARQKHAELLRVVGVHSHVVTGPDGKLWACTDPNCKLR